MSRWTGSLRRRLALAALLLALASLQSCELLMDEFFTLQQGPPELQPQLEAARGR